MNLLNPDFFYSSDEFYQYLYLLELCIVSDGELFVPKILYLEDTILVNPRVSDLLHEIANFQYSFFYIKYQSIRYQI
jgi:hypothetical protein